VRLWPLALAAAAAFFLIGLTPGPWGGHWEADGVTLLLAVVAFLAGRASR
jgi:hypothetical protein